MLKLSNSKLYDLLVGMCLCNPNFLTPILEGGLEKRYQSHSSVFINDLKNILINPRTNIKIAALNTDSYIVLEDQASIFLKYLENTDFNIQEDWNLLKKADLTAKKLSLTLEKSDFVYWVPNDNCNLVLVKDSQQTELILGKHFEIEWPIYTFFTLKDGIWSYEEWQQCLNTLTQVWHNYFLNNLKDEMLKYYYDFKLDLINWPNYQECTHDSYLGLNIPELKYTYKKLKDFTKDVFRDNSFWQYQNSNWYAEKKRILKNFFFKKIVEFLKSSTVVSTENGYYSKKLSDNINIFLESIWPKFRTVYYKSEKIQILEPYENSEMCVNYDYVNNFTITLGSKKSSIKLNFEFNGGEMYKEPICFLSLN